MLDFNRESLLPNPVTTFGTPHAPSNYHILVIDLDDPRRPDSLGGLLGQYGYQISHCQSHREVLDSLQVVHSSGDPDLIICDLLGDDMDGLEFLRIMRQNARPQLPVMIVTELESNSTFEKAVIDLGADDFVIKPVRSSELLLRVRLLLRGLPGVAAWRAPELI